MGETGEDYVELRPGRAAAIGGLALVAAVAAALPLLVASGAVALDPRVATALAVGATVLGVAKLAAMAWAARERWRAGHVVRLVRVLPD